MLQETETQQISYISGNGNPKKASYISGNGTVQSTPRKLLMLQGTETPKKFLIFPSKESCSYVSRNGRPDGFIYLFRMYLNK